MVDQFGRPIEGQVVPGQSIPGQPSQNMGQQMPSSHPAESSAPALSDEEFQEILTRNKSVSSSAISRAVQDASQGSISV